MTELKRCPFCGGKAERGLNVENRHINGAVVFCKKCGATTSAYEHGELAIEAWNTRPNPWHTGTPNKEDWYFVMWRDTEDNWTRFSALLWNNLNKTWYDDVTPDCNWCDEYHAEVIAWMPIPDFKENEDGRTD